MEAEIIQAFAVAIACGLCFVGIVVILTFVIMSIAEARTARDERKPANIGKGKRK